MFRSTPITVTDSAPNTDDPKSDRVSAALLVFPAAAAMLLQQSAAAVSTASSSAAAAIGLDYFSAGDSVSSSVFDYPLSSSLVIARAPDLPQVRTKNQSPTVSNLYQSCPGLLHRNFQDQVSLIRNSSFITS